MPSRPLSTFTKIGLLIFVLLMFAIPAATQDFIIYNKYRARAAYCKAQLHQIGLAVRTYQDTHTGKMPPKLKALLPITQSENLFVCPESGIVATPTYTELGYNYRFLSQPRGSDVIAWDSQPHHSQNSIFFPTHANRNVLLADGQVRNMNEVQFQQLHLQGQTWIISRQ